MRCNAMSKQTGNQCGAHAIKNKKKCKYHGGWSTGALTEEGRQRLVKASTKHGLYSKESIKEKREIRAIIEQCDDLLGNLDD